jgi:hypothetical protein
MSPSRPSLTLVAVASAVLAVAAAYEPARTFKASEILKPSQIKGPHYQVKYNERRLKELGASDEVIKELYLSKGFTLSLETRMVGALYAVKAKGSAAYAATAADADIVREAVFFAESAEMLQRFENEPLTFEAAGASAAAKK